jgi:hypothetical protein
VTLCSRAPGLRSMSCAPDDDLMRMQLALHDIVVLARCKTRGA